jgi:hypothetical protein
MELNFRKTKKQKNKNEKTLKNIKKHLDTVGPFLYIPHRKGESLPKDRRGEKCMHGWDGSRAS